MVVQIYSYKMDVTRNYSPCKNNQKQVEKCDRHESIKFKNCSRTVTVFEVFNSFRKNEILCDLKLVTDDGTIIFGHKLVLVSVSPYFYTIFTNFEEKNKELVHIKELHSTILQLLIDYIYTGEIIVNQENVMVLLPAADFFQLDYVKNACIKFLQTQLDSSNCLGIKAFADLYKCMELFSSSETYIKKQFLEVFEGDEFLSLSSEEVIKLISCNDLTVPFEEKVFESVINWVKHELDCRKKFLPKLMQHVRLSLASKQYILEKVVHEPLLKSSPECQDYIFEAIHFHVLKSVQPFIITQTIRNTPRQTVGLQKIFLVLSWSYTENKCITNWYDPFTNLLKNAPEMKNIKRESSSLCVIKDYFVLSVGGGMYRKNSQSVELLDTSLKSPCWVPMVDLLVSRRHFGIGVLNYCIYAIGGSDRSTNILNNAEVFDVNTLKWKLISSMSTNRCHFGVGVLNNFLYAVGGDNGYSCLRSVECYDPRLNTWLPVAKMSEYRKCVGVGVLDGVLYAVGGNNYSVSHKSVEVYTPSSGIWSSVADMHLGRSFAVALDGLLYVIGGINRSTILNSVEIYNPKTNSWSMKTLSTGDNHIYDAVVVYRPLSIAEN